MALIKNHLPCSQCGSSDAASIDEKGWVWCFSCNANYKDDGDYSGIKEKTSAPKVSMDLTYRGIPARQLTQEICTKYGYGLASMNGGTVQVAEYRKRGAVVAHHWRTADKDFGWSGYTPKLELFGQHLWGGNHKQLVITEGEIDCLSLAQTLETWPVVAVPGVGSISSIKDNIQWVSSFDKVILFFDEDEPGRKFTEDVAALLPPNIVYVGSTLPYKDMSELYLAKGTKAVMQAYYQAEKWHPAQLTTAQEVYDQVIEPRDYYRYDWMGLQAMTQGAGRGELVLVCAGTNVGKSLVLKNLANHSLLKGMCVGFIALEESSKSVLHTLLGMYAGYPLHDMDKAMLDRSRDEVDWFDNISFYTDVGNDLVTDVFSYIRYMAVAQDAKVIYIDHISAIFSRMTTNQRLEIDTFMYQLRSLAQELGIVVFAACHVRDPDQGRTHNEGAKPALNQLNGSSSLSRVPDTVIGVRRNTEDAASRHISELILLKHRFSSESVGMSVRLKMVDGVLIETNEFIEQEQSTDVKQGF